MPITIRLEIPERLREALALVASDARKHNIAFMQDEKQGQASGHGFAGRYTIYPDHILVTITKKIFVISKSKVISVVKDYWAQICAKAR
jgi:hypothetical protein